MRFFLKKIISFILFSLLLFSLSIGVWSSYLGFSVMNVPPLELTDSFSLNEKIKFLKGKKIETLALGSSMTLINLNSDLVAKHFKTEEYVNAGSWGMSMKDIYLLLKIMNNNNRIKNLIISSNICDFFALDKNINQNELVNYLAGKTDFYSYIKLFNLNYYIKNYPYLHRTKINNLNYESLCFDKYGGVLLASKNFQINLKRWNNPDVGKPSEKNFTYLKKISKFCIQNKIQFFFFQSPVRNGLWNGEVKKILFEHESKLKKTLIEDENIHFVSSLSRNWGDELFVDGTHFNRKGNRIFTKFCLLQLNNGNK